MNDNQRKKEICSMLSTEARMRSRSRLTAPGVRLRTVFVTVIFLSLWIGSIYICESVAFAPDWKAVFAYSLWLGYFLDYGIYILDGLIVVFVGLPLLRGWLIFFQKSTEGKDAPYATLFWAFENRNRYWHTLRLMLSVIGKYIPFLVLTFAFVKWTNASSTFGGAFFLWLCALLSVILGYCLWIGDAAVFYLAYRYPTVPVRKLFQMSRRLTCGYRLEIALFRWKFVGWALLSVLTMFLLTLFHTLPLYTFAHFSLMDALANYRKEELEEWME